VMGIGNADCGDDGVGPLVVGKLAGRLPPAVALLARGSDMLSLLDDWTGFNSLICVDASRPDGAPGRIRRLDLAIDAVPEVLSRASSHDFGLLDAIGLARALQCAPADIVIYAIEGGRFDSGTPITPEVAAAAGVVAERILIELGSKRPRSAALYAKPVTACGI